MHPPLPDTLLQEIRATLLAGHKLEAVRLYHSAVPASLAEAKAAVEQEEQALRRLHPEKFPRPVPGAVALASVASSLLSGVFGFMALWQQGHGDAAGAQRYGEACSLTMLIVITVQGCIFSLNPLPRQRWVGHAGLICVFLLLATKLYRVLHP